MIIWREALIEHFLHPISKEFRLDAVDGVASVDSIQDEPANGRFTVPGVTFAAFGAKEGDSAVTLFRAD